MKCYFRTPNWSEIFKTRRGPVTFVQFPRHARLCCLGGKANIARTDLAKNPTGRCGQKSCRRQAYGRQYGRCGVRALRLWVCPGPCTPAASSKWATGNFSNCCGSGGWGGFAVTAKHFEPPAAERRPNRSDNAMGTGPVATAPAKTAPDPTSCRIRKHQRNLRHHGMGQH